MFKMSAGFMNLPEVPRYCWENFNAQNINWDIELHW